MALHARPQRVAHPPHRRLPLAHPRRRLHQLVARRSQPRPPPPAPLVHRRRRPASPALLRLLPRRRQLAPHRRRARRLRATASGPSTTSPSRSPPTRPVVRWFTTRGPRSSRSPAPTSRASSSSPCPTAGARRRPPAAPSARPGAGARASTMDGLRPPAGRRRHGAPVLSRGAQEWCDEHDSLDRTTAPAHFADARASLRRPPGKRSGQAYSRQPPPARSARPRSAARRCCPAPRWSGRTSAGRRLEGADLCVAQMEGADLSGPMRARTSAARLDGAIRRTRSCEAQLDAAWLQEADLSRRTLDGRSA